MTVSNLKMEINYSFFSGVGIGFCVGIAMLPIKKYIGLLYQTSKAISKFTSNGEHKVVLVVRTDLNMGKGKIAAQCGHAAVGVYEKALKEFPEVLKCWRMTGQAKVALKTNSLEEIKQIAENARNLGLITSLICDAGRTQIAEGSVTVLGVGPGPKNIVDKVTGHLKLL